MERLDWLGCEYEGNVYADNDKSDNDKTSIKIHFFQIRINIF